MDKKEFEKLYLFNETAIKRFVYYKMPNKADGDDVLQEALLAAYQNRERLKKAESFKPWLLRIVANKCNDFYRKRYIENEIEDIDDIRPFVQSRIGLTIADTVHETLDDLNEGDRSLLELFYLDDLSQLEISKMLNIPIGTVKSRLYRARNNFKFNYPFPPKLKGEKDMSSLPEIMPDYRIEKSDKVPFKVKWEELMGWFIIPRIGEELAWAMYDFPEKKRSGKYDLKVLGSASVHGIEGVEIQAVEKGGGKHEENYENRDVTRTFIAQLTDTHCRILSESHYEGEIKRFYTFLDGDDFLPNWGFGEDNCGNEINLVQKGDINRNGNIIQTKDKPFLLDVAGRYEVFINNKIYDCICVMDLGSYNFGTATEQFIDKNGRTVLWRRFNRNNWKVDRDERMWSEMLPDNERLIINDEVYVHWYDCITDYIL